MFEFDWRVTFRGGRHQQGPECYHAREWRGITGMTDYGEKFKKDRNQTQS